MNPKDLSLYTNEIQLLMESSLGEITPEIDERLKAIALENGKTVDQVYFGLEMAMATATKWKEIANRFREQANSLEKFVDRQKYWIKELMKLSGQTDLRGENIRYKLTNGANKVVYGTEKVPMEYYKEVKELVLDKEAVKADLEHGIPVPGATLEPIYTLRSYLVTKKELMEKK